MLNKINLQDIESIAKDAGLKTIVVCNVDNSSMTRVADTTILTRAGIEKGVASTKAFSKQTVVLWMMALFFAKKRNKISKEDMQNEIYALREVPKSLMVDSGIHKKTKRLSKISLHSQLDWEPNQNLIKVQNTYITIAVEFMNNLEAI